MAYAVDFTARDSLLPVATTVSDHPDVRCPKKVRFRLILRMSMTYVTWLDHEPLPTSQRGNV